MSSVEREEKQPLVKPSTVLATGLAAALAAFFTSRFGIAGTVLGTALMAMIITAASALFSVYLERAAAKARNVVPGALRARPSRRSVLLGGLLTMAASFLVGMVAVTSVELSVGKSLSCWVWNECPTKNNGAGEPSASTGTRPSILGDGQKAGTSTPQPGGLEHPQQSATPHVQEPLASPRAPHQQPGAEPRQAPGEQPASPGGIPPDGQEASPQDQPSAPPDEQPSLSGANKEQPSSVQPGRPPSWVYQERPT
jgi:hypothetical protein